jgi:hypothetical protein
LTAQAELASQAPSISAAAFNFPKSLFMVLEDFKIGMAQEMVSRRGHIEGCIWMDSIAAF